MGLQPGHTHRTWEGQLGRMQTGATSYTGSEASGALGAGPGGETCLLRALPAAPGQCLQD